MTQNASPPIATVVEHPNEDTLIVTTKMVTLGGGTLSIESVWRINANPPTMTHVNSSIRFFTITMPLRYVDVPMEHVQCARQSASEILDSQPQILPTSPRVSDPNTLFLAKLGKRIEVFLDPISAIYWAGDSDSIQKVDLEYAKYALKADDETVIDSAKNATAAAWSDIDIHLALVDLGRQSSDHLGARDLGVDGVRSARRSQLQ